MADWSLLDVGGDLHADDLVGIVNQTVGGKYTSLQTAVDASAPGDTLKVKGTCVGTTVISDDLTLKGHGSTGYGPATLDGQLSGTVLTVESGKVVVEGLTITRGTGQVVVGSHPTILWGGGIYNEGGTVTLIDTVVTGNTAHEGAGIFNDATMTVSNSSVVDNEGDFGAGIGNGGTLTVTDSLLKDNEAPGAGNYAGWGDAGGIRCDEATVTGSTISNNYADGYGGGIYAETLIISDSTVTGNSTGWGAGGGITAFSITMTNTKVASNTATGAIAAGDVGGIDVNNGTITDSLITGNSATGDAGAIRHSWGDLTLSNTVVTNNSADGDGGGIYSYSGAVTFTNSEVSHNDAGGNGGGLWVHDGAVALTNSKVNYNEAAVTGGGIFLDPSGNATVTATNTTFAGNVPNDCVGAACP